MHETLTRLGRLGLSGEDLQAIVVTHEHGDHVRGVGALARRFAIPVWMSAGTRRACQPALGTVPALHVFDGYSRFAIGDLLIEPFPVPHDACEPCQFVFSDGTQRLGVLTDVGSITPHMTQMLQRCDALLLECNHDIELLQQGDYPPSLKQRVGGKLGHLNNADSAALLAQLDYSRLQHVVAMHLSEKNNTPYLARSALSAVLGCALNWIQVADQDRGFDWRELSY